MKAYYNEIDKYCVEWLRNLIAEGLIADGDVDDRSIVDVRPNDLRGYTQCHFFAGLGGWSGALRLAGWPDNRAVWTGSCPCQPFSLAGRQGGFADERHLWPWWRYHIAQRRPAIIFGEQVASAGEWLRLVRGDLEAMDYAVGAIPMEAASAGADHLRDRYWFVADDGSGRCLGSNRREGEQPRGAEAIGTSDHGILADANDAGSQGWSLSAERADQQLVGPDGVADADGIGAREPTEVLCARKSEPCTGGNLGDGIGERRPASGNNYGGHDRRFSASTSQQRSDMADADNGECERQRLSAGRQGLGDADTQRSDGSGELSWVIGADGKARRVKSGICLLAHGVPNRVAKLRALGNAIDLRPAAAFIKACA